MTHSGSQGGGWSTKRNKAPMINTQFHSHANTPNTAEEAQTDVHLLELVGKVFLNDLFPPKPPCNGITEARGKVDTWLIIRLWSWDIFFPSFQGDVPQDRACHYNCECSVHLHPQIVEARESPLPAAKGALNNTTPSFMSGIVTHLRPPIWTKKWCHQEGETRVPVRRKGKKRRKACYNFILI